MGDLIDSMPGIDMPVGEVTGRLASMTHAEPDEPQSAFRASQMNLIVHFGIATGAEEARARFDSAIAFSQRYPCRIIVLCPLSGPGAGAMRAKLFSQCYIGASHREMCYCEALVLGYPPDDYGFLANQVSTWLESDLPVYHWINRVPADRIQTYRDDLLPRAKRLVYHSGVEGDGLDSVAWPAGLEVRDLAYARLLPVRQSIGQFLSGFPPELLVAGLKRVRVTAEPSLDGEAASLGRWARGCLAEAAARVDGADIGDVAFERGGCDDDGGDCMGLLFEYDDSSFFSWSMDAARPLGVIEADLGGRRDMVPVRAGLMPLEGALAEAFFFQ